jgi:transcriptional regulator with XRE-family HTH domain
MAAPRLKKKPQGGDELRVGARLRHARLLSGMLLRDLAEKAGCSESMASKIENDKVTPSLTTLHRLCKALNMTVSSMLNSEPPQPWTILRAGERRIIGHAKAKNGEGTNAEVLIPSTDGRLLEGFVVVIKPGGHSGGILQHKGEEVGYVIEGSLELEIDGKVHHLAAGDSFHFPSDLPHRYANAGTTTMRAVWINTPPSF